MFKKMLTKGWQAATVAGCGAAGIFIVGLAFDRLQDLRMIERIPSVSVADLIPGEANLSGTVELYEEKSLIAPDSQARCVYYEFTEQRKTKDSDGDTKWETVRSERRHVPFLLVDPTGTIVINPETESIVSVNLASAHSRTAGDRRYTENRLDPGMSVFAMGAATPTESGMQLRFDGPGEYVPILSVHGEARERGMVGLFSLLLTGLGLLLLSLGMVAGSRLVGLHMTLPFLLSVTLTVSVTLIRQAHRMIQSDLQSAFIRLAHEREVRTTMIKDILKPTGIAWNGDWESLGGMINSTPPQASITEETAALISRHRVNLMRTMQRAERLREGFAERLIAQRMGSIPSADVDFALTPAENELLHNMEVSFQPTRLPTLTAGIMIGLGGIIALLLGFLGMGRIRVKRWIENIPTAKTRGVVYGLTEVKGIVAVPPSQTPLSGPLSGQPCAGYHYTVKEKRRNGKKTEWVTITDQKCRCDFLCQDADGSLPITPEGAVLDMTTRTRKREGRLLHEEYRLAVGGPIYALGCALVDPKTHDRLVMAKDQDQTLPFLISDRSESEIIGRKAGTGFILLTCGLNAFSLTILSLAGWQGGFGVMQYLVAALAPLVYMILFFIGVLYNDLVFLRRRCDAMWANIDVALKKRVDLLPSLDAAAKAHLAHEQSLHALLAQARAEGAAAGTGQAPETAKTSTARQLVGLVERYPELKADQTIKDLMQRMHALEEEVSLMRDGYNQAVETYNNRIERFPELLLARIGHFAAKDFFENTQPQNL